MKKIRIKIILSVFITLLVISIGVITNAKYIEDSSFKIANININKDKYIELKAEFKEIKMDDGKSKAQITASKPIKKPDGWEWSENNLQLTKIFTNNISYDLPIEDYYNNKIEVKVNITKATYIDVNYGGYISDEGWSFALKNNNVIGNTNNIHKIESLGFNTSGNIDKDFLQARAYVYMNGPQNSYRVDSSSVLIFKNGYNPYQDNQFKSMDWPDLITRNGLNYFQLGGGGLNIPLEPDVYGNNPTPKDKAEEYTYGISEIILKLKDYSEYSVVYQIYIDSKGWQQAKSDGESACYDKEKAISAFRMALVPKSEKQYLINTWNKNM